MIVLEHQRKLNRGRSHNHNRTYHGQRDQHSGTHGSTDYDESVDATECDHEGDPVRDAVGNVQSVLVLGGGSDIALHTVRKLVESRCETVLLAVRDVTKVGDQVAELKSLGAEHTEALAFDGSQPAKHGEFMSDTFARFADIDLVISAFAVLGNQDEFDQDPAAAADAVMVNMAGQISALTAAANEMKRQGHGTLVVLSSVAGERVRKDNAVYGATKAGLDGFCQALSDRLTGTGVNVIIVRPGFVSTSMTEGLEPAPFSTTPDKVADDIIAGIRKGSGIVWSPAVLRFVFSGLRHLPRPLWRIVSSR